MQDSFFITPHFRWSFSHVEMKIYWSDANPGKAEAESSLNEFVPGFCIEISDPDIDGFSIKMLRALSCPFKACVMLLAPVPRNRDKREAYDVSQHLDASHELRVHLARSTAGAGKLSYREVPGNSGHGLIAHGS